MNHRNAFRADIAMNTIRSQQPMYMHTMHLKGKEWLVVENYGIIARRFPTEQELNKACPYGMTIRTVNDDLSLTGEYVPGLILGDSRTDVIAIYELVRRSHEEANVARRARMIEQQAREFGIYRTPVVPVQPMRIEPRDTTFRYTAEGTKAEAVAAGIVIGAAAIVGLCVWAGSRR